MTEKPWKIVKAESSDAYCIYYGNTLAGECKFLKGDKEMEKNAYELARRLVASANACAYIPIDDLEQKGLDSGE